jgi:uncharacterized protein YbjT (DUF2867 family)
VILLTGATGTVGSRVAARLLAAGQPLRLMTRHPDRIRDSAAEVVVGDYADPDALRSAFTGVRAALVVTNNPLRPEHDLRIAAAARECGVRHLVKLSAIAVQDPQAVDLITAWQRASEDAIRGYGAAWTMLRPRAFMSNALGWAPLIRDRGAVRVAHPDAAVACVDPDDIADVAALVLTGQGHHGKSYELTGPRALTAREQVVELSRVLRRPVRIEEITPEQALQDLEARYPPAVARALTESAALRASGRKARTAPAVAELLGRPARDFAQWAQDHGKDFD